MPHLVGKLVDAICRRSAPVSLLFCCVDIGVDLIAAGTDLSLFGGGSCFGAERLSAVAVAMWISILFVLLQWASI